jgi:uncharacterized protein YjbI with pentapeptide repeats
MAGTTTTPVVTPLPGSDAAAMAWRYRGRLYVTVIAKATFALLHDAPMRLVEPQPIHRAEVHHGKHPGRSVRYASDLVPRLDRVDVVFTGHAHVPGSPRQRITVQLSVFDGQRRALDKELVVSDPGGFQRMPLVYERAVGGIGSQANPLGVNEPTIVDPLDPKRPGCFGPIGRGWPSRRRLLGSTPRGALDAPIVELPDDFAFAYFQAAPTDQQLTSIRGDEWLLLGGLHPSMTIIRTRLPNAYAAARIHGLSAAGVPEGSELALRLDTIQIDGDEQWCTLVFRRAFEVPDERALSAARITAGVTVSGEAIEWNVDEETIPAAEPPLKATQDQKSKDRTVELTGGDLEVVEEPAPSIEAAEVGAQTMMLGSDEPASTRPAMPFRQAAPPPKPERAAEPDEPPPSFVAPPQSARPSHDTTVGIDADAGRDLVRRAALPFDPSSQASEPPRSQAPAADPIPTGTVTLQPEDHVSAVERVLLPFISKAPQRARAASFRDEQDIYVPPRTSDAIPIFTKTPLLACTVPWQLQSARDVRTVVVKGTFDIVPDDRAKLRQEGDPPLGDVHHEDDFGRSLRSASEFAIFKTRADVTLMGHAYAPGGSSQAAEVGFRFGRGGNAFDRRVAVFGDRHWQKGLLSTAPERFDRMPLVYERAYGGPDFEKNPVGRGRQPGPDRRVMLPNLEDGGALVESPTAAADPMCFTPVPPMWRQRVSKLGTFDNRWRRRSWPYFPDDFDWAYFQHAPPAQQLTYLEGDEPFDIWGAHPKLPRITGKLGRVRPRCFAQRTTPGGGAFFEVVLRLDTVHFDIDEMKIAVIWRGLLEVNDDDASEIAELYLLLEDLSEKHLDVGQARARYRAVKLSANPALLASPPANAEQASPPPSRRGAIEEKLRAAGLSAGAAGASGAAANEAQETPRSAASTMDPAKTRAVRAEVERRLAASAPLDGIDLAGADLAGLDFSSRSLAYLHLKGARLAGCQLRSADLTGAVLADADLTDATLDGAVLAGADLTGAQLNKASFNRADLTGADFSRARGESAHFRGAHGAGARFVEGDWSRARFDDAALRSADFTRATLDDAAFDRAQVPDIRLYDARGRKVSFKGAELGEARADGAILPDCSLNFAKAAGSVWDKTVLDGSTLLGATLTGAGFVRASCKKAVFSGADLVDARLEKANLRGAALVKANLMRASLLGADLITADLRGANLHAAETWKAKLRGAQLESAIITKTKLLERA